MLIRGKIYTVWTPRGNMGSTVSAINIAKKLSKMKGDTLLIDLNLLQPRISDYMNLTDVTKGLDSLHPYASGGTLSGDIIKGNCDMIDDLFVLKGTLSPSVSVFPPRENITTILNVAKESFSHVIIDVHHNLNNPGTFYSLIHSDEIFVPMERDVITILSFHDLKQFLQGKVDINKFKLLFCKDSENVHMPISDIESSLGVKTGGIFPFVKEYQNIVNKGELGKIDKNKAFKNYLNAIEDFVSQNIGEYVIDKSKKKGVMSIFSK